MRRRTPLIQAALRTRHLPGGYRSLAIALIGAAVAAATEPMISWLLQALVNQAVNDRAFPLWLVPASVLGVFGVRAVAWLIAQYATSRLVMLHIANLSEDLFQSLIHATPSALEACTPSGTASAMVHDARNGATQLGQSLLSAAKDFLTLGFLFGYLVWIDWRLTAVVVILLASSLLVARLLVARVRSFAGQSAEATDQLLDIVAENVAAWRAVRLHGAQGAETRRFQAACNDADHLSLKSVLATSVIPPTADLLAASTLAGVVLASICLNSLHGESVATLLAFIVSMILVAGPLKRLAEASASMAKSVAHLERATALMSQLKRETGGLETLRKSQGHIALKSVTIQRTRGCNPTLHQAWLEIKPGEVVALLGPSGVGKTTLASALLRFVDLQSGDIELDGVSLTKWDAVILRQQFSVVSEDFPLLEGTVAENVSLGLPLDRERAVYALKEAVLLDYVNSLPMGLDAPIERAGRNLSLGQRQRMSIARAIYKNAPIIILDEPTSALDQHTEDVVVASLNRFLSTRTALVITHRLPEALQVQRVIRLESGQLLETSELDSAKRTMIPHCSLPSTPDLLPALQPDP